MSGAGSPTDLEACSDGGSSESSEDSSDDSSKDSASSEEEGGPAKAHGDRWRPKFDAGFAILLGSIWMVQLVTAVILHSHECFQISHAKGMESSVWLTFAVLNLLSASIWVSHEDAPFAYDAFAYTMTTWVLEILNFIVLVPLCSTSLVVLTGLFPLGVLMFNSLTVYRWYSYSGIMLRRIEFTEKAFGEKLGSSTLCRCRSLILGMISVAMTVESVYMILCCAEEMCGFMCHLSRRRVFDNSLAGVLYLVCTIFAARSLRKVMKATELPAATACDYLHAEATWARTVILRFLISIFVPSLFMCMGVVMVPLVAVPAGLPWNPGLVAIIIASSVALEAFCMVFGAGLFQPHKPEIPVDRGPLVLATTPVVQARTSGQVWVRKVRDLAERSIDVEELLAFYGRLGVDVMPHFEPTKSSTNDVVRHAIIPLSRAGSGGLSYAKGSAALPQRMVTHTWSNCFLHLCAAVVADALGQQEYGGVAKKMTSAWGRTWLEKELVAKGTLHQRYWICAFCVNQHASICGSLGTGAPPQDPKQTEIWRRCFTDSVTKELFPLCSCHQPKVLNDCPEECEINKFDDMMALIQDEAEDFGLLVAVDEKFDLFNRAWCVAELVQAHLSNLPLSVCLKSNDALDIDAEDLTVFRKLSTLSVQFCESTRPEDKEEILAKIPNVNLFDAHLQMAIFGHRGLLSSSFVGFGVLEAAARSARRIASVAERPERMGPKRSMGQQLRRMCTIGTINTQRSSGLSVDRQSSLRSDAQRS